MSSRRSFFRSLVKAAAIIALAPQIAFRAPKIQVLAEHPTIYQVDEAGIDFLTDRKTAQRFRDHMVEYYQMRYNRA